MVTGPPTPARPPGPPQPPTHAGPRSRPLTLRTLGGLERTTGATSSPLIHQRGQGRRRAGYSACSRSPSSSASAHTAPKGAVTPDPFHSRGNQGTGSCLTCPEPGFEPGSMAAPPSGLSQTHACSGAATIARSDPWFPWVGRGRGRRAPAKAPPGPALLLGGRPACVREAREASEPENRWDGSSGHSGWERERERRVGRGPSLSPILSHSHWRGCPLPRNPPWPLQPVAVPTSLNPAPLRGHHSSGLPDVQAQVRAQVSLPSAHSPIG